MASIDIKELEHLAELARLELNPAEKEKFLKDFQKILEHFNELSELPAQPLQIKARKVILREDGVDQPDHFANQQGIVNEFPEKVDKLLKVPPIFE